MNLWRSHDFVWACDDRLPGGRNALLGGGCSRVQVAPSVSPRPPQECHGESAMALNKHHYSRPDSRPTNALGAILWSTERPGRPRRTTNRAPLSPGRGSDRRRNEYGRDRMSTCERRATPAENPVRKGRVRPPANRASILDRMPVRGVPPSIACSPLPDGTAPIQHGAPSCVPSGPPLRPSWEQRPARRPGSMHSGQWEQRQ